MNRPRPPRLPTPETGIAWRSAWPAVFWLVLLVVTPIHARASPSDLAWAPPTELRLVRLADEDPAATLAAVTDLDGEIVIRGGQQLLVPAVGGTVVRLEGADLEVGFGTGFGPVPDAVVWYPAHDATRVQELRVPTWGIVRCLVVRGRDDREATAVVRVAARRTDPMGWYRADQQVATWLRGASAHPPSLPTHLDGAQPAVEHLAAVREIFGTDADHPAVQQLLLARWLAASARYRPIRSPFFASATPQVMGGESLPPEPRRPAERRTVRRIVERGGSLVVKNTGIDVVTFQFETRADQGSLLRISEGDALVEELRTDVPRAARDRSRWTPPREARAVPAGGQVRLEVVTGTLRVTVRVYEQRSFVGGPALHERQRLLRRAAAAVEGAGVVTPTLRVVSALAHAEAEKTSAAVSSLWAMAADPEVPTGLRALLVHDAIRNGLDFSRLGVQLQEFAELSSGLPVTPALALRRSALEAAATASSSARDELRPHDLSVLIPNAAAGAEADSVRLLIELLRPPRARARSSTAARAEDAAARSANSPRLTKLARLAWRRLAPWAVLKAVDESATVRRFAAVFPEPETNGLCNFYGPSGWRWLALDGDIAINVSARGGTHTEVALVGDPAHPPGDSLVEIDAEPIAVHGGAALGSRAAVRAGRRGFSRSSGAPVLVKVPSEDQIDCALLRDEVTWTAVRDTAVFRLPAGQSLTVASVAVAPETLGSPVELAVEVGGTTLRGWVRAPATGTLEIPIPPNAILIRVRVPRPLLIRVLARMQRWPEPAPQKETASSSPPPPETELVERVRQATRALRRASSTADRVIAWRERSEALEELAFRRYAAADRARWLAAGGLPESAPPPAVEAPLALELPPGSRDVEPLGSLPLIPPLPQPSNPEPLREVLAARELGIAPRLLLERLAPSAERSSSVDALLLAVLAEDLEEPAVASRAYARIGRTHGSTRALVLASSLGADAAVSTNDRRATLEAYVLAREVAGQDSRAAGVLARLQEALDWDLLALDEAAGSQLIAAYRFTDLATAPLGLRVRSALLDAPSFSVLSARDPVTTTVRAGSSYRVDALCHALAGPHEGCAFRIELDGKPVQCRVLESDAVPPTAEDDTPVTSETSVLGADQPVAAEHACWIDAPATDGRLVVIPPADREVLTWTAVRRFTEHGLEPVRVISRWSVATPEVPSRIVVRGPNVLKVAVRGEGGILQTLEQRVEVGDTTDAVTRELLDQRLDDHAKRWPGQDPVGVATISYVVLKEAALHTVSFAPDRGRVFLRVEAASARQAPRARDSARTAPRTEQLLDAAAAMPVTVLPDVGWDPESGHATLGVTASYVVADLSDGDRDPRSDYFELLASARRRYDAVPTWLRFSLLSRLRSGPETWGAEARLGISGTAQTPAAFAFGRLLAQRFPSVTAAGFYGELGASHTERVSRDLSVVSLGSVDLRVVDPRVADAEAVDLGIYSPYAADHPFSLDLEARLEDRPFVDLRGRVGSRVRLLPEARALDRMEGFLQSTLLGGTGLLPEVDVRLTASVRPVTDSRDEAFVRYLATSSVGFFAWVGDSSRLTVAGEVTCFVDAPATGSGGEEIAGMLGLSYDHVARRGVRDLDSKQRSFPERQEEGHAPPERVPAPRHPYWEPSR